MKITRKDVMLWGTADVVSTVGFLLFGAVVMFYFIVPRPPDVPAPVDATPAPTVLRVHKLEENVAARLLILDDDRVIPYDKLLMHADGAVVRDRSTGEEFTIIVEAGLPAPNE